MANLRVLKKEIDYRLEEFVFDCEMAAFVQPNKEEKIVELNQKSLELRNALYHKANNPAEPRTAPSLASTTQHCVVIWLRAMQVSLQTLAPFANNLL